MFYQTSNQNSNLKFLNGFFARMTGPGPLVQPNPSTQQFKIVIRNPQKININERFTGIMQAKGHISPFAKGQSNERGKVFLGKYFFKKIQKNFQTFFLQIENEQFQRRFE